MEVKRPAREGGAVAPRGSGPGARKRRADDLGPRKDVIVRMSENEATQLKVAAALERTTIQEFVLQAVRPEVQRALKKHKIER